MFGDNRAVFDCRPQREGRDEFRGRTRVVQIVIAGSMEEYGAFARKSFESNRHVTRFDTHVALERVKVSLALPV